MAPAKDTLVFIPAWNEAENLPAVLREPRGEIPATDVLVIDDGSTDRTAEVAREHGAEVLSFEENRGLRPRSPRGTATQPRRATPTAAAWTPTGSIRSSSSRSLELVRSGVRRRRRVTVRDPGGNRPHERYDTGAVRRLGTGLLRRSIEVVLDRPFHDATSGMYAVNAKAMPILARPYSSGAPEVEAVLRLHEEGLRVDEVPVEMRERASGESKLQEEGAGAGPDRGDADHGRVPAAAQAMTGPDRRARLLQAARHGPPPGLRPSARPRPVSASPATTVILSRPS